MTHRYKAGKLIYHISPYNGQILEGMITRVVNDDIYIRWQESGNEYRHYIFDPLFRYIITCCNQPE